MATDQLQQIASKLPGGAKMRLAKKLECDPAKITRAFNGMVKSEEWMERLMRAIEEITGQPQPA